MSTVQQPAPVTPKNGLGTAALILGILAVVFAFIPLVGIVLGPLLGVIALILGIMGMKRARTGRATNKGASTAGIVLGIIGIVVAILSAILTGAFVSSVNEAVESSAPTTATDGSVAPAPADETEGIVVNSCAAGDFGQVTADLAITNTDDSPKSFLVTVSVNGPDGVRVAEANATANAIAAGQTAQVQAIGAATDPPAELTCVIANVSSF